MELTLRLSSGQVWGDADHHRELVAQMLEV